ncbi:MAG: carbohydrate-binding protein [Bacteroidales bacterium]|nr:carbohydrate-binding protein [Bacteroidales bacterium]
MVDKSSGTCHIYVDGVNRSSSTSIYSGFNTSNNLLLGRSLDETQAWAYMDDVHVYNCLLTTTQINTVMNTFNSPVFASTPSVPQNLVAEVISSTRIDLRWGDSDTETGYTLERTTVSGNWTGATTYSPSANEVSYSNTGLTPGTTYYYRIKANNGNGSSGYSNIATGTASSSSYTLSITTPVHGTISANPSGPSYVSGTTVSLSATPEPGYQFAGWTEALTGTTNPVNLVMNGDKTVGATFTALPSYTLTINTPANGTITASPAGPTYVSGTTVSLTASPSPGFQFTGWTGAATGTQSQVNIQMNGNKTVGATFVATTNQSPYGSSPMTIPGKIEVEDYDIGGLDTAYYDTTPGNEAHDGYRESESVDVHASGDNGSPVIGWTYDGEWMEYTVNVTAGTYNIIARITSPNSGTNLKLYLDGTLVGSMPITNTGGFFNWQNDTLKNVTLMGGNNRILRAEISGMTGDSNFDINWIQFETIGNQVPKATNVYLIDNSPSSTTWRTYYTYTDSENDTEGASVFTWYYVADTITGTPSQISRPNNKFYTVPKGLSGNYFRVSVTPVATSGSLTGIPSFSKWYMGINYNLNRPAHPSYTDLSTTSVKLHWEDSTTNENHFRVLRKLPTETYFTQIAELDPNITEYTDNGLSPQTTYNYQIVATHPLFSYGYSEILTITTLGASGPSPANLKTKTKTPTSISLNWGYESEDHAGFYVKRGTGESAEGLIATLAASERNYTDDNVVPNTTYNYRVEAYKSGGATTTTAVLNVTTPDAQTFVEQYNGNIAAIEWGTVNNNALETSVETRRYDFGYDALNRLTSSAFKTKNPTTGLWIESGGWNETGFDYDLNGNIKALQRVKILSGLPKTIDLLEYGYKDENSNQLIKVSDFTGNDYGFKDGANETDEYLYDNNGNLREDKNKKITSIKYNLLNLPEEITFFDGSKVKYIYDATGAKLQR